MAEENLKKVVQSTPAKVEKAPVAHRAPAYDYGEMKGTGYEGTTNADFAVPYLSLLQPLSPEVGGQGEDGIIEGAKPGMLLNSVTKQLIDGKKGLIFVPVSTEHVIVEWRPRESGGGIVARHTLDSTVWQTAQAHCEFGKYKTAEGNDLVDTFYLWGYTLDHEDALEPGDALILTITSTKIKPYRQIMQSLRSFKGKPPLFANRLVIKTKQEKNNKGVFYNYLFAPLRGGVGESLIPPVLEGEPHPLLVFGKELHEQVQSGLRRAADDSMEGKATETSENPPF